MDKASPIVHLFAISLLTLLYALMPVGSAAVAAENVKLEQLRQRVIDAHGGAEALLAMRRFRQHGTTVATLRGRQGVIERRLGAPGVMEFSIRYLDGGGEQRELDGQIGRRDGKVVNGPPLHAMQLQAARLDLPASLLEPDQIQLLPLATSAPGFVIETQGGRLEIELDPVSGRIQRTTGQVAGPVPIRFVTEYGDYRPVEGRWFAFHEQHGVSGKSTGYTRLEQIVPLSR